MKKNELSKPKTRREIASELGISYTTFWRILKKKKISLPKGLLFPIHQKKIYAAILESEIE